MEDFKIYMDNIQGKAEFVEEVLNPLVINEGHFRGCKYVDFVYDEYIELLSWGDTPNPRINITANSIEAVARDFCKYFIEIINNL